MEQVEGQMNVVDTTQHQFCFEVLSDELRLRIVATLFEGEKTVGQLAKELNIERSRVSHALQRLRQCGYITARKSGRERVNAINQAAPVYQMKEKDIFSLMRVHAVTMCPNCPRRGGKKPFSEEM